MANVTAVTTVKQMTYRGDTTEEWSNKYYFTGTAPSTPTDWKALVDALVAIEKTVYHGGSTFIRAYGYDQDETDTSPVAVYSRDYLAHGDSVPGILTQLTGDVNCAGDQASCVSWKTSRLTAGTGKPIYLRKYYHSQWLNHTTPDTLPSPSVTALNNLATALASTGLISGTHFLRSRLHAETFDGHRVDPYITTRTLHRRGRRP